MVMHPVIHHIFDRFSFYFWWRKFFNPSPRSSSTHYHSLSLDFVNALILIPYSRPICSPELLLLAHKSFDYGKMTFLSSTVPTVHIFIVKKKEATRSIDLLYYDQSAGFHWARQLTGFEWAQLLIRMCCIWCIHNGTRKESQNKPISRVFLRFYKFLLLMIGMQRLPIGCSAQSVLMSSSLIMIWLWYHFLRKIVAMKWTQ